jgi:hypothetical protein
MTAEAGKGIQDMDLENGTTTHDNYDYESELRKVKSAGAVTISPELFERVPHSIMSID